MSIYKITELKSFLASLNTHPKKGLSQNFLIDGNIVKKILVTASLAPEDTIIEIGPGPGALSEEILKQGASLIAIEKDHLLATALNRFQTDDHRLQVFNQDFLDFDLMETLEVIQKSGKKAKIIANLPYHLTTVILTRLTPLFPLISTITVMVQEEFGKRMVAKPNVADYSSFTIFLNFYTQASHEFTVSRQCFYPAPSINSSILHLKLLPPKLPPNEIDHFFKITRTSFEQRRKMMRTSLSSLYSKEQITEALESASISPLARPEMLSLDDFLSVHRYLFQFTEVNL